MSALVAADAHVRVLLRTHLTAYKVTETPIAVPVTAKRSGLSDVVWALLGRDKEAAFDFSIEGALLRTSLRKHIGANKLSTEAVLVAEYFLPTPAPEQAPSIEADDWVCALAAGRDGGCLHDAPGRL